LQRGVTLALHSTANPKSDVEWKMYTAAKLPGPGQYEVATGIQGMKGGKFRYVSSAITCRASVADVAVQLRQAEERR
jgi:hypothetical protein